MDCTDTRYQTCGPCGVRDTNTTSVQWCPSCDEGLCENCLEYHSLIKASREHVTISVEKFRSMEGVLTSIHATCSCHDLCFEVYCPNHEAMCCVECAKLYHSSCLGLTSLESFVQHYKKSRHLDDLDGSFDITNKNIRTLLDKQSNKKTIILSDLDSLEEKIERTRENMLLYFEELKDSVIEKGKQLVKEENDQIDQTAQTLKEKELNLKDYKSNLDELKKWGTPLQLFVYARNCEKKISTENKHLHELVEGITREGRLEFQLHPNLNDTTFKLFDAQVCSNVGSVRLEEFDTSSSQISSANVTSIKATFHSKFETSFLPTTSNITSLIFLPCGVIVAVDYDSGLLHMFSKIGKRVKVLCYGKEGRPFGLTNIDEKRFAVSFPQRKEIKFFDTTDFSEVNTISLDSYCWGIHYSGKSLAVAFKGTGIRLIDLTGALLKSIPYPSDKLFYLYTFENIKFYVSNFDDCSVTCVDETGKEIWRYKSKQMKGARNMFVDNGGHVFVACQEMDGVHLIDKDGKKCKLLVPMAKPKSLVIDCKGSILYVSNVDGSDISSYKLLYQ